MAYIPSTLSSNYWSVPLSINGSDAMANLDDTVNAIINTNSGSLKNHFNTELDRVRNYLSAELTSMYGELGESMAHKWAEEAEDVEVSDGEYSAHHWAIKASALLSGLTASYAELNVLDGITPTTAELNKLHGVTASTADINKTSNITSGTWTPSVSYSGSVTSCTIPTDGWQYIRVGNIVTISGQFDYLNNGTGEGSIIFSPPIASAFTFSYDANGSVADYVNVNGADIVSHGIVSARTSDGKIQMDMYPGWTSGDCKVVFQYTIK